MTTDALDQARRALHLDIPCPVCGAGFSQPCRSSSGKARVQVHAKRSSARWVQPDLFTADEDT